MAAVCGAYTSRFIGRGKDRVTHEGACVLDRGHDLDCLPSGLAMAQAYNQAYNAAITDVLALMGVHEREALTTPLPELIETLRRS